MRMGMWWLTSHIDSLIMLAGGVVATLWAWQLIGRKPATVLLNDRSASTRSRLKVVGPALVASSALLFFFKPSPVEEWREFTGDGSFSVMLPNHPTYKGKTTNTFAGPATSHVWLAGVNPSQLDYLVRYTDIPSTTKFDFSGSVAADIENLRSMGFQLQARSDLPVSGFPGTTLEGSYPDGRVIKIEFILAMPRQFVLIRTARPDAVPAVDRFFSSFKVTSTSGLADPGNGIGNTATTHWRQFRGDGKFSVSLPAEPVNAEQKVQTPDGEKTLPDWRVNLHQNRLCFSVSWTDLPLSAAEWGDEVPKNAANVQRLEAQGVHFSTRTPKRISGFPGLLLEGTAARGTISVKMLYVWVGRREYSLTRSGYPDLMAGTDVFFSSFKIASK